jgi:protocatechuate 3,4-dioxygenase beta subunit
MTTRKETLEQTSSRRDLLIKSAAGAFGLAALGANGTVLAWNMVDPTPGVTEGPYWVEELLNRSDIRTDPVTGITQVGLPLSLQITVLQLRGKKTTPLPNAIVDIWHCNALGVYSDEAVEDTSGEKFLRGLQITNKAGKVGFTTIYPGWYSGRTVHIHVRVRLYDAATESITYNFVTQMFFDDTVTSSVFSSVYPYNKRGKRDTVNKTDSIFTGPSEDDEVKAEAGQHLLLKLARSKKSASATFTIVIDTSDAGYNNATGGSSGGPGGPGGPPPG